MTDSISHDEMKRRLKESYHEFGLIRCTGCNDAEVDLSDADDFEEACQIWNDHVQEHHT